MIRGHKQTRDGCNHTLRCGSIEAKYLKKQAKRVEVVTTLLGVAPLKLGWIAPVPKGWVVVTTLLGVAPLKHEKESQNCP